MGAFKFRKAAVSCISVDSRRRVSWQVFPFAVLLFDAGLGSTVAGNPIFVDALDDLATVQTEHLAIISVMIEEAHGNLSE